VVQRETKRERDREGERGKERERETAPGFREEEEIFQRPQIKTQFNIASQKWEERDRQTEREGERERERERVKRKQGESERERGRETKRDRRKGRERERETQSETETDRERERDRERNIQIEREKERGVDELLHKSGKAAQLILYKSIFINYSNNWDIVSEPVQMSLLCPRRFSQWTGPPDGVWSPGLGPRQRSRASHRFWSF